MENQKMTQNETEELLNLFKAEYTDFEDAQEILKGIKEDLKNFAERIEIDSKAILSAWNIFKKYASGKVTSKESSDAALLEAVVVDYFTSNNGAAE